MADKKQLTVAELLARNAKDRPGEEKSPRRRRRSLDEGGISVAELTGNLEKVKATPAEAKHSNVSIDETAPVIPAPKKESKEEAPKKADKKADDKAQAAAVPAEKPSDDDTRVIQKVKDEPKKKTEDKPEQKSDAKEAEKPEVKTATKPEAKTAAPVDEKPQDAAEDTFTTGELEAVDHDVEEYDDYDDEEDEDKLNPFAVVLLALVGIVLGAIVFKGFEILWDRFDRLVVLVLGVVVTGVIVGIVHALRTSRDGLSMFLAAVAGLVLTFGPLLVVM
ncbi:hypothetical protein [Corynebacterium sp. HMSC074E01]|uniref:hypothetical protein n=1 Tax=Corynebacterium sp. HMSC074E01 TaxID=1715017 RepID=UPI0008A21F3B|nr:hypothetical protein [Corynebacterium sp. HMSC074E01]OFN78438.1 hypothetical protein HMPREF2537_05255 [Corynebacterium sp. HMSC074E01]